MLNYLIVVQLNTTQDEQLPRDQQELVEITWCILAAQDNTLVQPPETIFVKPVAAQYSGLTNCDQIAQGVSFKDAITQLDRAWQMYLIDTAFVTLSSFDLRVSLPREARDKGTLLPAYLQHACVFDLKKEYAKWQSHHPESLSYPGNNLGNICAALDVNQKQPFVLMLADLVRGLVRKSTLPEDHSNVLAHPYDANSDIRAFLGERSKVLYISGLHPDTTQPELETWFHSCGSRPMAFWTLKTADHKHTGTGFVVYSSHEEATESLALNGRALNDRIVEIQASSASVLDRAQEILVPFPATKNRPRPGDWNCPSCGFSNFQRRTACFRCSFPAASAATIQDFQPQPRFRQTSNNVPFRAGDWKCANEACSYHNFAKNVSCLRCGAARVSQEQMSQQLQQAQNSSQGQQGQVNQMPLGMMQMNVQQMSQMPQQFQYGYGGKFYGSW